MFSVIIRHMKKSSNWVRDLARVRDTNTCQMCGKVWDEVENPFPVHHLDGLCGKIKQGYDKIDILPRLVTLCPPCHPRHPQHSHYAKRLAIRQRNEEIKEAFSNNETMIDIAKKYDLSYQIVVNIITGYTPPESPYAKLRREYRELLSAKKTEDKNK